jgi:hypothetical protein
MSFVVGTVFLQEDKGYVNNSLPDSLAAGSNFLGGPPYVQPQAARWTLPSASSRCPMARYPCLAAGDVPAPLAP